MKKQEMANTSLKENRTHGTVQYPVALYEWNGENEWHVVPHWHEEMEWIYFQKGDFPVWINTKEYQVHVHPSGRTACTDPGKGWYRKCGCVPS